MCSYNGNVTLVFMSNIKNFGTVVERSEIMLGDLRKFWFQTANFGWSNACNTKSNLKLTFLTKKTHFIDVKPQETIGKCKNRCFLQNGLF